MVEIAKQLNGAAASELQVAELALDERTVVIRQLALGARAVLCPMAAILGGIVGQEVVKASTAKFHPICQVWKRPPLHTRRTRPFSQV